MAYPQIFLDWEAATQERGEQIGEKRGEKRGLQIGAKEKALTIALRLLNRRIGVLDQAIQSRVVQLSSTQLEDLSEAILDFSSLNDLNQWLSDHPPLL
ncbi:MAG: DUF4351 domain-containing protein [Cyanobacteria bacterium]|nr:DUF4351 domain-containing protein [Cyanobacteriota bacterium]